MILLAAMAVATPASALPPPPDGATEERARKEALTSDLRYGHWFLHADGGVWVPSASFIPEGRGLTAPGTGGYGLVRAGFGVNGTLEAFLEGGVSGAAGVSGCSGCGTTSWTVGAGLAAHLTQGLAVDPWISYAAAYRDTLLRVDDVPGAVSDAPVHGIDFARIAMGFEHRPLPWLGIGPVVATHLGVRLFDGAVYGDFTAGLQWTFDPVASGTKLTVDASR